MEYLGLFVLVGVVSFSVAFTISFLATYLIKRR